jgi:hypothetical protein
LQCRFSWEFHCEDKAFLEMSQASQAFKFAPQMAGFNMKEAIFLL